MKSLNSLKNALMGGNWQDDTQTRNQNLLNEKFKCEPNLEKYLPAALDDFKQLKTLGTGTFGRVSLAEFTGSANSAYEKQYYAVKTLKKKLILKQRQVDHVRNEITLLCSISHPFIINMVNNFDDKTSIYMILEYVPGGELFSLLRDQGRISNRHGKFYASQVAAIFFYLHAKRIAYRDLKPENVLIAESGYLKLADFGFAKIITDRSWTLCGTPEYLAPEVVTGKGHGLGVDWWAFGVLIYEMLTGFPPFFDESHVGIYQKILAGNVEYPTFLENKCISLIRGLLQHDLSHRLGCLKNGSRDIEKAPWFAKLDWNCLLEQKFEPIFVPTITGAGDTSNFDDYPEEIAGGTPSFDVEETAASGNQSYEERTNYPPLFSEEELNDAFKDLERIGFSRINHERANSEGPVAAQNMGTKATEISGVKNNNENQVQKIQLINIHNGPYEEQNSCEAEYSNQEATAKLKIIKNTEI